MVISTTPHARILAIDPSAALALPGVHGYFDHRDLADRSIKGKEPIRVEDNKDRVFADGLVTCVGMAIGIIVAETAALARRAALWPVWAARRAQPAHHPHQGDSPHHECQ